MHKSLYYYIAAATTTGIAGILHLVLAYNGISRGLSPFSIFFLVAGLAQLFWILPMVKRWGRIWYYIGIVGTIILMIIYAITRIANPLTGGRALPINDIGIARDISSCIYNNHCFDHCQRKNSTCRPKVRAKIKIIM
jgi:hypothetical protein